MRRGAKLLIEMVPLSAETGAEPVSPSEATGGPKLYFLLTFLLGPLVAGLLVAMGGSVASLVAGAF